LLQDDGCSLSSGEQQVAAKMMGKLMQGGCCNAFSGDKGHTSPLQEDKEESYEGKVNPKFEKYITLGPDHCANRRKHARKKKPKYASEIDSRIHDEVEDSISRENVLKRDHNNMTKRQSNRSGMEYIQKHIKRKSLLEKPSKRQQKEGLSDNGYGKRRTTGTKKHHHHRHHHHHHHHHHRHHRRHHQPPPTPPPSS